MSDASHTQNALMNQPIVNYADRHNYLTQHGHPPSRDQYEAWQAQQGPSIGSCYSALCAMDGRVGWVDHTYLPNEVLHDADAPLHCGHQAGPQTASGCATVAEATQAGGLISQQGRP